MQASVGQSQEGDRWEPTSQHLKSQSCYPTSVLLALDTEPFSGECPHLRICVPT